MKINTSYSRMVANKIILQFHDNCLILRYIKVLLNSSDTKGLLM